MNDRPLRIAMWSGPRNISTALMRSFENRDDTVVWDEPLYGYYLHETGLDHPGADTVIAHWGKDWRPVVERLIGPVPDGAAVWYQKHMVHHLLPAVDFNWLTQVTHCFLIRDPDAVLSSYHQKRENVTADDLGFAQQSVLFERLCDQHGAPPPVIDAADILRNPRAMLMTLCDTLKIRFDERMLAWPAGRRDSDGIWAKYWYAAVEKSTGFQPYRPRDVTLTQELQRIADHCRPHYEALHRYRLMPAVT